MTELVDDCPRCGAQKMTFDVKEDTLVHFLEDFLYYEAFCVCRDCRKATVFELKSAVPARRGYTHPRPTEGGSYEAQGYISVANHNTTLPPKHCPPEIDNAFQEGAKCMAVGCYNAAGAMFRLCLDLATKKLASSSKDSGRYKVANCTQAQPVFYGFAGLPDGKVILVSVLRRS